MALTRRTRCFLGTGGYELSRSTHDFASGASSFRRVTPPPSQVSLREFRGTEIASPAPRERGGLSRSETPSFGVAPLFTWSSARVSLATSRGLSTPR